MGELDQVYEDYGKKHYTKEEYSEFKRKEKNEVYELIDETAKNIIQNEQELKKYLDTQAKFEQYSVGNALLILAQMPEATLLRDYQSWIGLGGFPKKFRKKVKILEPGDSYIREDGTEKINYNMKYVYDISQVNIKQKHRITRYDNKVLLKAFLNSNQGNLQIVDEIPNSNRCALYDKDQDTLYIARGSEAPLIFYELTQELAKQELGDDNFKINCVSYSICKKYGIDVSNYNVVDIPFEFKEMSSKEIREELEPIRDALENINTRANHYIEMLTRQNKEKSKTR